MPVHHAKEFLKSVHNEAIFSHLISRTLMEVRSMNFKAKNLRMAFFYSEYLYVSMVEPAPESPVRYPLYYAGTQNVHAKFWKNSSFGGLKPSDNILTGDIVDMSNSKSLKITCKRLQQGNPQHLCNHLLQRNSSILLQILNFGIPNSKSQYLFCHS